VLTEAHHREMLGQNAAHTAGDGCPLQPRGFPHLLKECPVTNRALSKLAVSNARPTLYDPDSTSLDMTFGHSTTHSERDSPIQYDVG